MRNLAYVLVACVAWSGCSGDADDDDGADPGPGVLTLDGYPPLTNQMMLEVTGRKEAGAGVLLDGEIEILQDSSTAFSITLDLTEGPNRFRLAPIAKSLAEGDTITVEVTLDSLAPGLRVVMPMDGATNISVDTSVIATFSETIDCAGLSTDAMSLAKTLGGDVMGTMTCDDRTLTFTPAAALDAMTEHSVTIDPEVKDAAGNVQNIPAAWSFTTGA